MMDEACVVRKTAMLGICVGLQIKLMNGQFANDSQFNYEVIGTVLGKGQIFTPDKYNCLRLMFFFFSQLNTHTHTTKKYTILNIFNNKTPTR